MKILVANIGSTSLKWRLFDCSDGGERLLHKGGFERVLDYPKAIDDCLGQLRDASVITSERDLAAVGFKTVIARDVTGCVRLDERVLGAMAAYNGLAPATTRPTSSGSSFSPNGCRPCLWWHCLKQRFINSRPGR